MARMFLTAALIVLLNVLVGCEDVDRGRIQLRPQRIEEAVKVAAISRVAGVYESDIVEQVVANRLAYQQGLEMLEEKYCETGDKMKLEWAQKELRALNSMPQYNYIVEAGLAGAELKATDSIGAADALYQEALSMEQQAKGLVILRDDNLLRRVLDKYNQVIRKYPTSDKIDDAAYRAGSIHEEFKDYTVAILYYQRTYQWDAATPYPAVFNRAYILDRKLHRMAEALDGYRDAVNTEGLHRSYKDFAQMRIEELTQSDAVSQ